MKLKPLACLLGLGLTTPAWAIGLGDLTVHSHLGQPLHATVEVLGAPANLDAACFSLRPVDNGLAAPSQARFRVEPRGQTALLHITTPRSVNDPIAQFVLTSDCEARLQREYVVLLDPPVEIQPVRISVETPAAVAPVAASPAPRPTTAAPVRSAAATAAAAPSSPPAQAPRATAAAQAQPRSTEPRRNATAKPAAKPDARLVISGSKAAQAGKLPAGPDAESAPPADNRPPALSPTELSDENTALSRRLAHLEAQLAALHQRNAELEARLAASKLPKPEAAPQQPPRWPLYLLGFGLLAGGGLLAALLRRRSSTRPGPVEPTLWVRPRTAMPQPDETVLAPPMPRLEPATRFDEAASPAAMPPAEEAEDLPLTARTDGTDVHEDILDQAEVFVAHGYSNLAISLLQEHVKLAPTESPVPWMLLLDLLRREGDVAGYAEASADCRRHFNVSFPDLPGAHDPYENRGLESYPHVLQMLTVTWNSPDLFDVFRDLIYDRRGGVRTGFEPAAYRDILLLRAIAEQKSLALAA